MRFKRKLHKQTLLHLPSDILPVIVSSIARLAFSLQQREGGAESQLSPTSANSSEIAPTISLNSLSMNF